MHLMLQLAQLLPHLYSDNSNVLHDGGLVVQWTVLCPILCLLSIGQIGQIIIYYRGISYHCSADDMQLHASLITSVACPGNKTVSVTFRTGQPIISSC